MNSAEKIWEVSKNYSPKKVNNLESIIKLLLVNRGLINSKQQSAFLDPAVPDTLLPEDIGLNENTFNSVMNEIRNFISTKEKIYIYGDYDADGICATAVLWEAINTLGGRVMPYLPDRFSEGYGINFKSVKNLVEKDKDIKLIITVDNGVAAGDEIAKISRLGIKTIILDHHQIDGKKIPKKGILHTSQTCAAAIAWMLALKLLEAAGKKPPSLDLVAIAVIADQVKLIGANRSLVKYGLTALQNTSRPGLLALYELAGITKPINTYTVGFLIAPRINAMGRMASAMDSLRLLCTTNRIRAGILADKLDKTNSDRQSVVEETVLHAQSLAFNQQKQKVIIVAHESYHEGVIGLAAARLVEQYYRPAIVISIAKDFSKASARSVAGFDIFQAISKCHQFLESGGGHPMAAGFSIKTGNIEEFSRRFLTEISVDIDPKILLPKLKVDAVLDFDQISDSLVNKLNDFEPFGMGNPAPLFKTCKAEVLEFSAVGLEKKHLKLTLRQKDKIIEAIAFGLGEKSRDLINKAKIDIVYQPEKNAWMGNTRIQLKIRDIKLAK